MDTQKEDARAAKLALARKKLKDHQEKKVVYSNRVDTVENITSQVNIPQTDNNNIEMSSAERVESGNCEMITGSKQSSVHPGNEPHDMDINVTEILISNKRNLECQITELESKLSQLNSMYSLEVGSHNTTKQQLYNLQSEFKHTNDRYVAAMDNIVQLDKNIKELSAINTSVHEERHNLADQLEFTKSILSTKETENASLRSQLHQLQSEFDVTKLQLQQLNTGSGVSVTNDSSNSHSEQNEILLQKVKGLEQQLNVTQKERDQINTHYENYVGELNVQLKSVLLQNEELSKKVQHLSVRESNLIEQISDMEIRLQNMNLKKDVLIENQTSDQANITSIDIENLQEKYTKVQEELQSLKNKYMDLEQLYAKSDSKVIELQEIVNANSMHENISISKLTADIASDKVAAQRATEQNKKLKSSMQELEEAFVKMSQDKLDLTEKLTAEKYLNRELTIKLADIEEKSKNMHTKLMAKDEEMIRLQVNYRDLEKEFDQLFSKAAKTNESPLETVCSEHDNKEIDYVTQKVDEGSHDTSENSLKEHFKSGNSISIPQEDAMFKLQERFMKIMGEVADLSDEKHRLEHIILQLQNETDTICEYVALYQQQRSLLKKRDEERIAQIQLFQVECDRLKNQLEELSGLLIRFAEDQELATYFEVVSRKKDMEKVRSLLLNLKSNTLVDPKNNLDLSNVYPCNCCSGNLIDV